MKSVIICEGSTDYTLLQYYMRKVHGWEDDRNCLLKTNGQRSRNLKNSSGDILSIMATGGCSQLISGLHNVLDRNKNTPPNEDVYSKIVIITDRDEIGTEDNFIHDITSLFQDFDIGSEIKNDCWTECHTSRIGNIPYSFSFLLLVIPFEDIGAMETFLLNSIKSKDPYDKEIIEKGVSFVDAIDPDEKYLKSRRHKTKAKFDVFFCIRTAVEQFQERQNILKQIPWETYIAREKEFQKLSDL